MYDIYGSPGFLAAYNAGPKRLDDYLSNARSLPDENSSLRRDDRSLRHGQPPGKSLTG